MALHNSFFFPTLHRSLQPFNHLFLSPPNRLWHFPSLLLAMSLIANALKDSHNFCLYFEFWSFFIKLKNWKDKRLLLIYLWWLKFLRRNQVIYFNWQSEWKLPAEDVTRWFVLKTLLFRRCFSNILLAQINYHPPKRVKLMPTKVTT